MIERGDICWVDLGEAVGSRPAKRPPVLVVQADTYTRSRLATVIVAVVSSNTALATMPGNVFLAAALTGLSRDSVVNVTALVTVNEDELSTAIGTVCSATMHEVDRGLHQVLGLRAP